MTRESSNNPYAPPKTCPADDPASVPPLAPPQSLQYELSVDDLVAHTLYATHGDPVARQGQRRYLIFMGVAVAGIFAILGWTLYQSDEPATPKSQALTWTFILMLTTIYGMTLWRRSRWGITSRVKSYVAQLKKQGTYDAYMGPRMLTIDEQGLHVETSTDTGNTSWLGVKGVVIDGDYTYITLTVETAHIIPRAAFPTVEAYLGFANLAQQLHQEHGPKSADQ